MTKQETIKVLKENVLLERANAKRPGVSAAMAERSEKAVNAYMTAIRLLENN